MTHSSHLVYSHLDGELTVALAPYPPESLDQVRVARARGAWEEWRGAAARDGRDLLGVGEGLAAALIPFAFQRRLQSQILSARRAGGAFRLFVEGDESLPWEAVRLAAISPTDPVDGILAREPDITVIRRSRGAQEMAPAGAGLRILVVTANPASDRYPQLAWLASEVQAVETACHRGAVDLKLLADASPQELQKVIEDFQPHLFHFAGHAEAGDLVLHGSHPRTAVLFAVGTVAEWLAQAGCLVALLSACETSLAASAAAGAGIRAVVGIQAAVTDASLPVFSRVFYSSLLDGAEIDRAVAEARLAMAGPSGSEVLPALWCDMPFAVVGAKRFAASSSTPNNLPGADAITIGRTQELAEIESGLEGARVCCLVGSGGIGKSHLARTAARQALVSHPDGVWFVDCGALFSQTNIWAELGELLEIDRHSDPVEATLAALKDRRCLIVLDCFEVLAARDEISIVGRLLHETDATVLITSRTMIPLPGVARIDIGPLGIGGIQAPAESLLLELAGITRESLKKHEISALSEACASLDGVPLAIAVAAGRAKVVGVDELRNMLAQSPIRALGGVGSAVGVAIERSLGLLPEGDRELLLRLSIFAGSFDWEAAETVYPNDRFDMLDGIERLVNGSLLRRIDDADKARFQIMDSVRDFLAATVQAQPESAEARGRHVAHYLRRAVEAAKAFEAGQWPSGTRIVRTEIANFRRAVDFAREQGEVKIVASFAECLCRPLMEFGMWADFRRFVADGYRAAEVLDDRRLVGLLLGLEGALAGRMGDQAGCMDAWVRRAVVYRAIGDATGIVDVTLDLASEAKDAGELERSLELLAEAEEAMRTLGRTDLEATASIIRAMVELDRGQIDLARDAAIVAESKRPRQGERDTMLYVKTKLGHFWARFGDLAKAEAAYISVIEDAVEGDRRSQAAIAAIGLSATLERRGKIETALMCALSAEMTLRALVSSRLGEAERRIAELHRDNAHHPAFQRLARMTSVTPYELLAEVTARSRSEGGGGTTI